MLPILFYATLTFWFLILLQAAVIPFWMGDLVFMAILFFYLYLAKYRQNKDFPVWGFWIPLIFGLGMASYLFFSLWSVLPYLIGTLMLTYLMTIRRKWIFRWKEGFGSILAVFLVYGVVTFLIIRNVMQYAITTGLFTRLIITFIVTLIFWGYFAREAGKGKIR